MKKLILLSLFLCLGFLNLVQAQQLKKVNRQAKAPISIDKLSKLTPLQASVPVAKDLFNVEPNFKPQAGLPIFTKNFNGPKVVMRSDEGLPVWMDGTLPSDYPMPADKTEQAFAYLKFSQRQMQIRSAQTEFQVTESHVDEQNISHFTLQQIFNNIEVYGAQVKVHLNQDGPYLMNGRYFPTPKIQKLTPDIAENNAIEIVKNDVSRLTIFKELSEPDLFLVQNHTQFKQNLVIYHKINDAKAEFLAWHIVVYPNITHRYEYFVDAINGKIIDSYESLCGFYSHSHKECAPPPDGPASTNATDLNNKSQLINTYISSNKYYLIDATKSMFNKTQSSFPTKPVGVIITLDGQNKSPNSSSFNYTLLSSTNNTWGDKSAVSAHANASLCYDYYLNTHGRKSIDGKGGNIISLVNIADDDGSGLDNAFWNGESMFYGNGAIGFKPLAGGLDVGGHEMSHGVVQTTANLVYQGESGALNESYADVYGVMIDRNNWLIGENVVKSSSFPSGALRSMSDPHNGGSGLGSPGWQPKHVNEKYTGSQDNGGVHINSGIPNYAFFLFASDANVGKDKAEKVYYKALTDYLVKSSVFVDARAAVIQAATDLYGGSSAVVTAAQNAFAAVGIGSGGNAGGSNYQNNVSPNPGNDFIVATDGASDKVYLTYGTNFSTIDVISNTDPSHKFSVVDDGTAIVYAGTDKKIHAITIDYNTGNVNELEVSSDPIWANAAISKDGSRIAAVTDAISNEIYVYDFTLAQWHTFQLYNPTYSQGVQTGDVLYADILEWDFSGNYVMYDAYNEIKDQTGGTLNYWDIGFMRVFDKKSGKFGDGQVSKLYNGLPENTSIGNPTFSKNSPYIVAFDYIDEYEGEYYIVGTNIENGDEDAILNQGELGYPSYSRLDDYIIYNSSGNTINESKLASNKISYGNASGNVFTDARLGYWFANGQRDINIATHEQLDQEAQWAVYPNLVKNELLVKSLKSHTNGSIQIFNTMGTPVGKYNLDAQLEGSAQNLNLSNLASGTYIIRIQSGQEIQTNKIIKE